MDRFFKKWWWCATVFLGALACSGGRGREEGRPGQVTSVREALSSVNGLSQNGLTTNGLWNNGLWNNGLWNNGLWNNGLWNNGLWNNGLWNNGLWNNGLWNNGVTTNGLWNNGLWNNGLWNNGLWNNGLTGQAAIPGNLLRGNAYLRQLLQYIYTCAMPGTKYDATGAIVSSYDTTLDPNGGTLSCMTPADGGAASCDVGYECSSDNKCVVPLRGGIGLGINGDGSTWWGSGTCDETCQRWVSACVLARTNAYGVHVEISMRAPADAPQAIQDALAVSDDERAGWTLREGAYFGNIFATTPVNPPPAPTVGPDGGLVGYSGKEPGPIANTPAYYACAGPGSNIPEITKRFCSSQGDQVVIKVPGVCLATSSEKGLCAPQDPASANPMQDCYTSTTQQTDANLYKEVITVFLKTPVATCGNAVCETGEDDNSCPSDCHPGSWARGFATPSNSQSLGLGITNNSNNNRDGSNTSLSALGPDDSIVVAGTMYGDLDLGPGGPGCGTSPAAKGVGLVAKYDSGGNCLWAQRFGGTSNTSTPGGQLFGLAGLRVAPDGHIVATGFGYSSASNTSLADLWITTFPADGSSINVMQLPIGTYPTLQFLQTMRPLGFDSAGNIVLAGMYLGTATFGSFQLNAPVIPQNYWVPNSDVFVTKVSPQGSFIWAKSFGSGPNIDYPLSLSVGPSDEVVFTAYEAGLVLTKLSSDGNEVWSKRDAGYYAAAIDKNGAVDATGYLFGSDLHGGQIAPSSYGMPFVAQFGADGSFGWMNEAHLVCAGNQTYCSSTGAYGINIGFDRGGNVIAGALGNPSVGGGIDFGVGVFPTYSEPNIFLASYEPKGGVLLWAKQIPIVLQSFLLGLDVDSTGHVIISGNYSGSMQADDRMLVTSVPEQPQKIDSFVASFAGPPPLDKTPPDIGAASDSTGDLPSTIPLHIVEPATSPAGATVFYMPPTAIDDGNAGTSVSCRPPPNTTFPVGTTTVTCTASDPAGNHSTATFDVTVADYVGPAFSPTSDITVEATGANGAPVPYTVPTATDQISGKRTVTCSVPSGAVFPVGKTVVTCSASDAAGNGASTSFSVTVTAPPVTVSCVGAAGAPLVVPTSPDLCGATLTPGIAGTCQTPSSAPLSCTLDGASAETLGLGDHAVAVVGAVLGATAACTSYVRVVDGEAPKVTCVGVTAECSGAGRAVATPTALCTDNCGCQTTSCAGGAFPLGTSAATCTATDNAGNGASCQAPVTVVDTTPPVVTPLPGPASLECNVATWNDPGAKAVDACVGDLSSAVTASGGIDPTRVGTYSESYLVVDPAGNVGGATRSLAVVDTLAPGLKLPSMISVAGTGASGAAVTYLASASDICDGSVTPSCSPVSGSTFPYGINTVACTTADAQGNTASGSFRIQVQYNWSGILQPINADGSSIFKLGSTVPVKFQLTGGSAGVTSAAATLSLAQVSSSVTGTYVEAVSTSAATSGNAFRYDITSGQYIFNLSTKGLSTGTWNLSINLADGAARTVSISLR
jgi:hypothetical protein